MGFLLDDIALFLTEHGLCKGLGVDIFTDKLPDSPDECYVLFEYDGAPEVPYEQAVQRNVQLICRATSAIQAKTNATSVHNLIKQSLDETGRIDYNGRFTQTTLRQTPFKLDEDEKNRVVFGFDMGMTTSIDE